MNKAGLIRKSLGLSMTECGTLLISETNAYRKWYALEKTGKWDNKTEKYFNLILKLINSDNIHHIF